MLLLLGTGLLGIGLLSPAVPAVAADVPDDLAGNQPAPPADRKPLDVPRVESRVTIDGVLDEEVWKVALSIPVNTEVQPGENIPAPVDMEVLLAYGPRRSTSASAPTILSRSGSAPAIPILTTAGTTIDWRSSSTLSTTPGARF